MRKLLIALLVLTMLFVVTACNPEQASSDPTLVEITKFEGTNYGTFTDKYYRTAGADCDTRTITDGKWDLSSGGGAYYVGSAKTIEYANTSPSFTETYDAVIKAGDKLQMTMVVSNYAGLYIGGNAHSNKSAVSAGGDGLIQATDATEATTFEVTMEVKEGGVDYAIKEGTKDPVKKTITYTLADGESVRLGFTWWATSGNVESIKIERL
jgi:hypothetical protein